MGAGMTEYKPRLHGNFAVKDGVVRECAYLADQRIVRFVSRAEQNPDEELYVWHKQWNVWIAELPADQFDAIFSVNAFARYCGHRCHVDSIVDDGSAELIYADSNFDWATQHEFVQHDKGTFRRTAHISELYDFHEEYKDLLFAEWREQNFKQEIGESS
jgi:hypothetical protein